MNGAISEKAARPTRAGGVSVDVVLAYQDFSAGMHGLRTFDRVFANSGAGHVQGQQRVWRFDLLSARSLAAIAAGEAEAADMVIFAMHSPGILPPPVKRWVRSWTGRRSGGPGAMVLLLDGAGQRSSRSFPAEAFLKEAADGAGMDFFLQKTGGRHALDDFDLAMHPGGPGSSEIVGELLRGMREVFQTGPAGSRVVANGRRHH